ncbi:TIM10 family protein [Babesia ovata]|uniref:Mitochondrial import inner membrane translocase subunit n=1 Tax=Babesia ovata TaxID=189622 RepID=A0A2H6KC03_9APIC|nr:TIM10 family protein [Babesia ovata]GBE60514.1 TIM10 family protein [Babesia ovata]
MDASADPVNVAVAELVGMADMLKRMRDSCWNKCIAAVKVERMDPGEQSCVDRCVNKPQTASVYDPVHRKLGSDVHVDGNGFVVWCTSLVEVDDIPEPLFDTHTFDVPDQFPAPVYSPIVPVVRQLVSHQMS